MSRSWLLLLLALAAVLAAAALVVSERLPRIGSDHAHALAVLRAPTPPLGESDGFAALWTARHAIPDSAIDAVTAESAAAWQEHARGGPRPGGGMLRDHPSLLPPINQRELPCPGSTTPCLDAVRADIEGVRTKLRGWEDFRLQNRRLYRHDHIRSVFPPLLWAPTPPLKDLLRPELTRAALLHVDGDSRAALKEICLFGATWRRLGMHTDTLIVRLVGARYLIHAARLHADILVDAPLLRDEPNACPEAFAALTDAEFDLCPVMRREFAASVALLDASQRDEGTDQTAPGLIKRLGVNREHLQALSSAPLAWYCGGQHAAFVSRREPLPRNVPQRPRCSRIESLLNPLGCKLLPISKVRHREHYHRLLDVDAMLRLHGLARWLGDAEDVEAAFLARPARWHLPHHRVHLEAEENLLRLEPLAPDGSDSWSVRFARQPRPAAR